MPSYAALPLVLWSSVRAIDCSKYSSDYGSQACEHRTDQFMGVFVVAALVVLVIGFIAWRVLLRRNARRSAE